MANKKPVKIESGRLKELGSTDTVPTGNLGTGTADGTTFLRGDQTWAAPPGGSTNTGRATLDFGAFPGASDASVAVTGQTGITADSEVMAWILPIATADHSADEHMLESLKVFAGNIVAGTGFTIYGFNTSEINEALGAMGRGTRIYGQWTVAWVWN